MDFRLAGDNSGPKVCVQCTARCWTCVEVVASRDGGAVVVVAAAAVVVVVWRPTLPEG